MPSLAEIEQALDRLRGRVVETPTHWWRGPELAERVGVDTRVAVKLELLQHAGSFKVRGALLNVSSLDAAQRARGVIAVSSGNHAVATSYAAREVGCPSMAVMLQSANPARVALCKRFGGDVVMAPDGASAFELAEQICVREGRTLVHPYDGALTILGTATLGLEFASQAGELDAVVMPIGGGGLCAGVAAAVKQVNPGCLVIGVETPGADVMHRSFALGRPAQAGPALTIADSLAAPFTTPLSFGLCQRFVDDLVMVEDAEVRSAMALIFRELKQVVEPAAAASTAALIGPLRQRLRGLRVGIVFCGTNIDFPGYALHMNPA